MFPDQRSQTPTHFVNLIRETGHATRMKLANLLTGVGREKHQHHLFDGI